MPDWPTLVVQRLRDGGAHADPDATLVQELAQHLEDRYRACLALGMTDADATAAALAELEGHDLLATDIDRARKIAATAAALPVGTPSSGTGARGWIASVWQDLRYAARTLRRSPGFTTAAILTVALTTGPATAMLGIANWLLLRPLPEVVEPHRLATVNFGTPLENGYRPSFVSYGHVASLVAASPSVAGIVGWQPGEVSVARDGMEPRITPVQFVEGHFFDLLGVRMVAGRPFHADEDVVPGGLGVAVISERFARVLFPSASAVDQSLRINGHHFTIVGVAPAVFPGTRIQEPVDLWLPGLTYPRLTHVPAERWLYPPDRGPFYMHIARLAPGATFARAEQELRTAALALSTTAPEARKFATVQPMLYDVVGFWPGAPQGFRAFVAPLIGVGLALVLLGAANLANLFVFRSARRAHESALRRALGASAGRLARLPLFEAVLVAAAGGLLGVGLIAGLQRIAGRSLNTAVGPVEIPVDWSLTLIALALSLGVGLILGWAPARLARRTDLSRVLTTGSRSAGRPGRRLRSSLAAVQVALSLLLVVGALLFVSTLRNLRNLDAGVDVEAITRFSLGFRVQGYTPDRAYQFMRDLSAALRRGRPTDRVAFADAVPLGGASMTMRLFPAGGDRTTAVSARTANVSDDYFATLGLPLVAGRPFTADELARSGPVPGVIVSETLARQLFGRTDAVGQAVSFTATIGEPQHTAPVVGVAKDARWNELTAAPIGMLFRPRGEMMSFNNTVLVRSNDDAPEVRRRVRAAVASLDPTLPITAEGPFSELFDRHLEDQRLFARVLSGLALLGFVLAAIGIHGLVSQTVVERTREFGVRLAIGATRGDIVRLVLRSALVIVAIGGPAGIALAYGGSRLVANRLFGVTPGDPAVYVTGAAALLLVVVGASLTPARAASRANPVDVLRSE